MVRELALFMGCRCIGYASPPPISSHTAIDFRGRWQIVLQSMFQAPSYRNHRQVRGAESSVRLISVQISKIPAVRIRLLAPKLWQAGGCVITGVMISEVLF